MMMPHPHLITSTLTCGLPFLTRDQNGPLAIIQLNIWGKHVKMTFQYLHTKTGKLFDSGLGGDEEKDVVGEGWGGGGVRWSAVGVLFYF